MCSFSELGMFQVVWWARFFVDLTDWSWGFQHWPETAKLTIDSTIPTPASDLSDLAPQYWELLFSIESPEITGSLVEKSTTSPFRDTSPGITWAIRPCFLLISEVQWVDSKAKKLMLIVIVFYFELPDARYDFVSLFCKVILQDEWSVLTDYAKVVRTEYRWYVFPWTVVRISTSVVYGESYLSPYR